MVLIEVDDVFVINVADLKDEWAVVLFREVFKGVDVIVIKCVPNFLEQLFERSLCGWLRGKLDVLLLRYRYAVSPFSPFTAQRPNKKKNTP